MLIATALWHFPLPLKTANSMSPITSGAQDYGRYE